MKVAFINHSRDLTGYGHSALDLMGALDYAGVDVISCWTTLNQNPKSIPEEISKLEVGNNGKNLLNIDAVITYSLPQYYTYVGGVKNIGIFCNETTHFTGSNWQYQCNIMDEIWVLNDDNKKACIKSGVTTKVQAITPAHNRNKYEQEYKPIDIVSLENKTVFYTISEISYRKGIGALLNAYFTAFTARDNVVLVVKGFFDGKSSADTKAMFKSMVDTVRSEVKRQNGEGYPEVVFINDWLTEEQIMGLHKTCNCFVSASKGEAENIPLFEAAAMGNICVGPKWSGPEKILKGTSHKLINVNEKYVVGMGHTLNNLYLPDETWFEPSPMELVDTLKRVHKGIEFHKELAERDSECIKDRFSYETVGPSLKNKLEVLLNEPQPSNM